MLDERFWSKVNKDAPGGCWVWTANRNNAGYGMFSCRGLGFFHKKLAHRLSYEFSSGPIPQGKHVMHSCDNPACVNPDHLSVGTRSDNMRDCANKFRSGNQIVTSEMRNAIISDYISGTPRREIAKKHGISPATVSDYISGKAMGWMFTRETREEIAHSKQTKPSAKLNKSQVSEIKSLIRSGVSGVEIASRFNIHRATVSDIKTGRIWRDVD